MRRQRRELRAEIEPLWNELRRDGAGKPEVRESFERKSEELIGLDSRIDVELLEKAASLGIDIPPDWGRMEVLKVDSSNRGLPLLTVDGRVRINGAIRYKRMTIAKEWVAIVTPIIQAIGVVLSTVVAILSLLIAMSKK